MEENFYILNQWLEIAMLAAFCFAVAGILFRMAIKSNQYPDEYYEDLGEYWDTTRNEMMKGKRDGKL